MMVQHGPVAQGDIEEALKFYCGVLELKSIGALRNERAPGAVLGLNNTTTPNAIETGQAVDLVHQMGTLKITAKVKALQSGQPQSWVHVENPSTKKITVFCHDAARLKMARPC